MFDLNTSSLLHFQWNTNLFWVIIFSLNLTQTMILPLYFWAGCFVFLRKEVPMQWLLTTIIISCADSAHIMKTSSFLQAAVYFLTLCSFIFFLKKIIIKLLVSGMNYTYCMLVKFMHAEYSLAITRTTVPVVVSSWANQSDKNANNFHWADGGWGKCSGVTFPPCIHSVEMVGFGPVIHLASFLGKCLLPKTKMQLWSCHSKCLPCCVLTLLDDVSSVSCTHSALPKWRRRCYQLLHSVTRLDAGMEERGGGLHTNSPRMVGTLNQRSLPS